ncbi:MAG TPA: DUF1707 domain-containing protein [Pseudonocardiaceae bacterium]|nr:DUF1707 domain-containing protein [Pseudonocardiaceae bacterium]
MSVDNPDVLASDAERDHVIDLLQRAVGQGMLDLDEFGSRTDAVLAAQSRSELNAVLLDLPDLLPDEPVVRDVLVLRSVLSEVRRTGHWSVPPKLLLTSRLGLTRLDFTRARLAGRRTTIELAVTGGLVELRMPRKATVLTGGVRVTGGRIVDRRPPERPGDPVFLLGGRILAGELRITRPGWLRRLFRR